MSAIPALKETTPAAAPADATLADALARLAAADHDPVPIERDGEVVGWLLTPQELERLEDERDLAILRAERAGSAGQPTASLEEIAAELGVELTER